LLCVPISLFAAAHPKVDNSKEQQAIEMVVVHVNCHLLTKEMDELLSHEASGTTVD
jgi:hypothetical protein